MSSTKLSTRIFAGVGAAVFLVTSLAFTIMVIWQEATKDDVTVTGESQTIDQLPTSDADSLAGKPLAGFAPLSQKVDQLQIIDTKVGEGDEVKPGQTIKAHYTGAVADTGVVFQSSYDMGEAISFSLDGVIPGWTEGIPGMKVGGERRLIIPAEKAYGATPPQGSGIPENADLVFDVKLMAIE